LPFSHLITKKIKKQHPQGSDNNKYATMRRENKKYKKHTQGTTKGNNNGNIAENKKLPLGSGSGRGLDLAWSGWNGNWN